MGTKIQSFMGGTINGRKILLPGLIWTSIFLIFILPPCAAKSKKGQPKSRKNLFKNAEKKADKITDHIQNQKTLSREQPPEALEHEEDRNRARAIQKYRALLANKKQLDPATHEASLLNLGHLIFEQCLAQYRKDMRTYDDKNKQFQLGYQSSAPSTLPQYNFESARRVYRQFIDTFPASPRQAEVFYNLAYSYEEEGDLDKAVSYYDELALAAPSSPFVPEMYMRLGEHNFEMELFPKAIEYYEKVLGLGETQFKDKALFKIGWAYYALNQLDQAKDSFARLLLLYTPKKKKELNNLYNETLRILAKLLSETGGAPVLEALLKKYQKPAFGFELSIKLGDQFQETSRYQEAIETYQKILHTFPYSPQAPFIEQSLIQCLKTERRDKEAEERQASLVDHYGKKTPWDQKNPDPELRQQVDEIIWNVLSKQILAHHKIARGKKDPAEYNSTIKLYQKLLTYFPTGEKSYETRFRFADCLYESGHFKQAAEEYERISKTTSFDRFREKSASKRIQCLELLRKKDIVDIDTLLASYQDYCQMFPKSDKTGLILFKQGEILFNSKQYINAAHLFKKIIQQHPNHPKILRAWLLELESLFEAAKYPELEQWSRELLKQPLVLTDEQKSRTAHLLSFALFEQAHANQKAGDYLTAAQRYEQLVAEAPQIKIAPDALFNAAICYKKVDNWSKAASCFEKIIHNYAKSKYYTDSLLAPLQYYEQSKQWDLLLINLNKLYQKDPKNSLAKETLYKLAKRFYNNSEFDRSREIYELYERNYPTDISRRLEIVYLKALMNEKEGRQEVALQGYSQFLKNYKKEKARNPSLTVDALYQARAQFQILDPLFHEYAAIQLSAPLEQMLAKKQSLLDRLVSAYMKIVKSGAGEYALASAFRIGASYENYWKSLINSEIPPGLSKEEKKVYQNLLNKQAAPYVNKASKSYQVTLKKAREKSVFNHWVLKAYSNLSLIDPTHYPPLLQDALIWQENLKAKRKLIRTIDLSIPRTFSSQKATSLQESLTKILGKLHQNIQKGKLDRKLTLATIKQLKNLVKKESSLYEVYFDLGILYQMIGDLKKAQQQYELSLQLNPNNPIAQLSLALIFLKSDNAKMADKHLQTLIALLPNYAQGHYLLGVCQIKKEAYAQAVPPLQKAIALLPQFLDPYIELGKAQKKLGQDKKAHKNFNTVLSHKKASSRVLRNLGYQLLEAGWLDDGLTAYNRILKKPNALYEDWNNRGVASLRQGNPAPARKDLNKALLTDSNRPEAYNNSGLVFIEEKEYKKAIASFQKVLDLQPSFHAALLNTAVVYGQYLEDMEKSAVYMKRYLEQKGPVQREMLQKWLTEIKGRED